MQKVAPRRHVARFLLASLLATTLTALHAAPAAAQQDTTAHRDSLARQLQRLQRQIDSLKRAGARQEQRLMELDERGAAGAPAPRATGATSDTTRRRGLASTSGVYGKPFVRRFGSGTVVGGYVDFEYINEIDAHRSRFDQHRLVPFIFSEITDRLHFGTEIEFEHGPALGVDDGEAEGSGEINVEFATLDYSIREGLNLRGGIVLSPLGRFNLVHDSPVNDLVDRPLVTRSIIPTTLSESGFGIFGTVYPTERALVGYELYVVNGFTNPLVFDAAGAVVGVDVRNARGERGSDNDFGKSLVGRLAVSPFLGLELGASAHRGSYAAGGPVTVGPRVVRYTGDERLTIVALDATLQRGPIELLGEYGRISVDLPENTGDRRVAEHPAGYYLQANYHFGHGLVPPTTSSVFTGVVRWDQVDTRAMVGARDQRLTLGLNWRPVEDAALKADFQWNWRTPGGSSDRGDASRRLLLSMASYF